MIRARNEFEVRTNDSWVVAFSVGWANFESMKRIMKKVRHPFIVELLDDIKSQQNIFLIIELVRGGDLYDFITESGMLQIVLIEFNH